MSVGNSANSESTVSFSVSTVHAIADYAKCGIARTRIDRSRDPPRGVTRNYPSSWLAGWAKIAKIAKIAKTIMKTVAATEAKNRLGAILDAAQREPIVIRRQDRDIAVVLSMADYDRLRAANARVFLELRDEIAAEAARAGLTDQKLADLVADDDA